MQKSVHSSNLQINEDFETLTLTLRSRSRSQGHKCGIVQYQFYRNLNADFETYGMHGKVLSQGMCVPNIKGVNHLV